MTPAFQSSDCQTVDAPLIPSARPQHDPHDGEHDRHLDERADDGRERRARLEAKERDRSSNRQLEEIRRADQR